MTKIILIAAVSENYVIGKDNKLPWHIPEDLKRFEQVTTGHPVIIGRKSYDSIPKKYRPLRKRFNIVLSSNPDFTDDWRVFVSPNLEHAIERVDKKMPYFDNIEYNTTYILGGEKVYKAAISIADMLDITHVHRKVEGDTFFPEIDPKIWKLINEDKRNGFSFVQYVRI